MERVNGLTGDRNRPILSLVESPTHKIRMAYIMAEKVLAAAHYDFNRLELAEVARPRAEQVGEVIVQP
jgi:hypothetical protein